MNKTVLEKKLARLKAKKDKLVSRGQSSENVDEVREINEELQDLNEEIAEVQEELDTAKNEEQNAEEQRSAIPTNAQKVNGNIVNGATVGSFQIGEKRDENPYGTMEYRKAFMAYAQKGTPIPSNLIKRDVDGLGPANTDTLGATIPVTIMNEFINEVRKVYGNLYSKVRKLNIPGGVKFPIAQLSATFKWVTESTVSQRQDGGNIDQYVEFSYNIGEIRVSQTLLSSIVTLDLFEREVVRIMTIAYLQAMDKGIVNGSGKGEMLGILNDTRIPAAHSITMNAADINNWTAWRKKFFAKLPLGYRNGEFIFPLSTVESYLETMADSNNNPIFRQATGLEVNDGDSRNPNGRFFGREVSLVEPDVLPDFDTAQEGDVIGIFWQPNEYAINSNLEFGIRRYYDEERNEWVNKALTIVDGKILNPMGYYLIKKGSSGSSSEIEA